VWLLNFLHGSCSLRLLPVYYAYIDIYGDQLNLRLDSGYTLVNSHMRKLQLNGKLLDGIVPRRPASADHVLDPLKLEGVGYNDPNNRFPNGADPYAPNRWYSRNAIPIKSYKDFHPGPSKTKPVQPPPCPVCGSECTNWNTAHTNEWWCHFCAAKVRAVYSPNMLIPDSVGTHFEPLMWDRKGEFYCHKCMEPMSPRVNNSGYDCLACGADYKIPNRPRPGPII
jgi:hypothetical protein